jgi:hypothetical protein
VENIGIKFKEADRDQAIGWLMEALRPSLEAFGNENSPKNTAALMSQIRLGFDG